MSELSEQIKRARAKWKFRGDIRPDFASVPGAGQESVWDYPRPPKIDPDSRTVLVKYGQAVIAESMNSIRILETSSPPVFYIPEKDRIWLDQTKESTVRVLGAIHKPGRYPFNDTMTILDLLAQAGGTDHPQLTRRDLKAWG